VLGEIEIESYVDGLATPVGGESGHFVDAEQGAHAGIVHGAIAAGLRESNIFDGAIAENGERDDGVSGACGADRRIDGALHPIVLDTLGDTGNVPGIARGKFGAALAAEGEASGGRHGAWLRAVAGGNIHLATFAVGHGVIGWRRFVLEGL